MSSFVQKRTVRGHSDVSIVRRIVNPNILNPGKQMNTQANTPPPSHLPTPPTPSSYSHARLHDAQLLYSRAHYFDPWVNSSGIGLWTRRMIINTSDGIDTSDHGDIRENNNNNNNYSTYMAP